MFTTSQGQLERVAPSVKRLWMDEGRVFVYTVDDTSKASVDAYIDSQLTMIRAWPAGKPFVGIHDISGPAIVFSAYLRQRLDEVADAIAERRLEGCSAVVLPHSFVFRVFATFARMSARRAGPGLQQEYFTSKKEALRWIASRL